MSNNEDSTFRCGDKVNNVEEPGVYTFKGVGKHPDGSWMAMLVDEEGAGSGADFNNLRKIALGGAKSRKSRSRKGRQTRRR